jgi:hypothetical protein
MIKSINTTAAITANILFINAQNNSPLFFKTKKESGIEITQKDSLFGIQFQFRMQNRAGYLSKSEEDLTPQEMEFRVRRLRMRMKGFVANPKLTYYILHTIIFF